MSSRMSEKNYGTFILWHTMKKYGKRIQIDMKKLRNIDD